MLPCVCRARCAGCPCTLSLACCMQCRYTLGEVKDELLESMGLKTEEAGSTMEFLRQGYKTSTWWEDDEELEKSDAWRT